MDQENTSKISAEELVKNLKELSFELEDAQSPDTLKCNPIESNAKEKKNKVQAKKSNNE